MYLFASLYLRILPSLLYLFCFAATSCCGLFSVEMTVKLEHIGPCIVLLSLYYRSSDTHTQCIMHIIHCNKVKATSHTVHWTYTSCYKIFKLHTSFSPHITTVHIWTLQIIECDALTLRLDWTLQFWKAAVADKLAVRDCQKQLPDRQHPCLFNAQDLSRVATDTPTEFVLTSF